MPDAIEVDLSGPDQPHRRSGDRRTLESKWAWFGLGLGLGLAVAALLSISASRPTDDEGVAGGTTTTTTVAPREPAPIGISEEVPGFPDGLNVLVSPGEGRALEVLTWPLIGEPAYRSIPVGDLDIAGTARFDVSGQFLAVASATPDAVMLQAGRPNTFGIVASGINAFVWHDSKPADLAWTSVVENATFGDQLQVWVSDDAQPGEIVFSETGSFVGQLGAWGDWGFAIVGRTGISEGSPTFVTRVYDPTGDVLAEHEGWIVASHGNRRLLLEHTGELRVVHVGSDEVIGITGADLTGDVVAGGEFSPDGNRVAVTSFAGVSVVNLDDGSVSNHSIRAGSPSIDWSSDGRFLAVSLFRGVAIIDTSNGEIHTILDLQTTRAVSAVPIGGV